MADTKRGRERKGADKARQTIRRAIDAELDAGAEPPREREVTEADGTDDAEVDGADDADAEATGRRGRDPEGAFPAAPVEFDDGVPAAPDIGESPDGDD